MGVGQGHLVMNPGVPGLAEGSGQRGLEGHVRPGLRASLRLCTGNPSPSQNVSTYIGEQREGEHQGIY